MSGRSNRAAALVASVVAALGVLQPAAAGAPQVAGSSAASVVVRNDRTVWQWGAWPGASSLVPVQVRTDTTAPLFADMVAASQSHFLASNGSTVHSWGTNGSGQLGDGTTQASIVAKSIGDPCPSSSVTALAAGLNHSLVLCSSGAVYAFGSNGSGQAGTGAVGGSVLSPTQVVGVGGVGTLANVVAIAAGASSSYAVRADGTVVAWGINTDGQLGDATITTRAAPVVVKDVGGAGQLANAVEVKAAWNYALVRRADGTVVAFGANGSGQLGNGTTGGTYTSPVVVQAPGGGALSGIRAIGTGGMFTSYAITNGGRLLAWGENVIGMVGDGTNADRNLPVETGLSGVSTVAGNYSNCLNCDQHALAVTGYGLTYSWGFNGNGQLGIGQAYSGFRATPGLVNSATPMLPFYAKVGTDAMQPRSDVSGDLASDVLWTEPSTGSLYLWSMNGRSSFPQSLGAVGGGWALAGTGDFDFDGAADLLWRHADGSFYVWFMDGAAIRGQGYLPWAGPEWSVLAVNDFTGDGASDILLRRSGDGALVIWQVAGLSLARVVTAGALPADTWSLAASGDFNGDGRADMLWRDTAGGFYAWITGLGGMNSNVLALTDQGALPNPGLEWTVAAASDIDGDGKADIVFRRPSDGANYLWRMNGKAIASQAALPFVGPEWSIATVGDFNGDGRNDLFFRRTDGVNYVWLMNDATIVDQGTLPSVGPTWSVVAPK
jgi:alpha-tubulin suppressor-like RCC1 family protein